MATVTRTTAHATATIHNNKSTTNTTAVSSAKIAQDHSKTGFMMSSMMRSVCSSEIIIGNALVSGWYSIIIVIRMDSTTPRCSPSAWSPCANRKRSSSLPPPPLETIKNCLPLRFSVAVMEEVSCPRIIRTTASAAVSRRKSYPKTAAPSPLETPSASPGAATLVDENHRPSEKRSTDP